MSNYDTVIDILVDIEVPIGDHLRETLAEMRDWEKFGIALDAAGVDNWDGYEYAMEAMDD